MIDLLSLAARVEQLTGPCRETDLDIACLILDHRNDPNYWAWQSSRPKGAPEKPVRGFWSTPGRFRSYTKSVDAAMTLVPENHEWEAGTALLVNAAWAGVVSLDGRWQAKAATPALALTAASLRARAALEGSHG